MRGHRILRVVVGESCSLCDLALHRLRVPAALLSVRVATERLDDHEHRTRYETRVPVLLDRRGRILDEGRVSAVGAWRAVLLTRLQGRSPSDLGT